MAWVKWVNLILGILIVIAPFVVKTTDNVPALAANVVLGILVIIFAFVLTLRGTRGEATKS
ncbi:MAG: SPW repeat protein [Clostridia bacterium]|nr:SPW repeat protein [Clostridia bacterium]